MTFHCLFEQSGTFKKEFKKLGYQAEDYDILNDFGETDHVIDLFEQINLAYEHKPSIFDTFKPGDQVLAFFPCVRFEVQIIMGFKGCMNQMRDWTPTQKLEYDLKLHDELHEMYGLITKLALVCIGGGLSTNNRKPLFLTTLLDSLLGDRAIVHRPGQARYGRPLQETNSILVHRSRAISQLCVRGGGCQT